ncbi:MAG: hypothetical protein WHV66_00025 [Anaerolineales bacterium]
MDGCPHYRQIADNYGVTCEDCGEILEGYGFWGSSGYCRHVWLNGECIYCQAIDPDYCNHFWEAGSNECIYCGERRE